MATAKKNVPVEDEIMEEEVKPAAKKVNKPKHDPNELVVCRSVRFGELRLIGPKTHMPYSWANEGDFREVEYQDLVSWRALHSRYLFDPMIIIEDEDIVEEWKADLGKLYDGLQEIDLKELFKSQKVLVDALVAENEALMKQQEELNKKVEKGNEYLDQLALLKRDFENYKRRTQNNQEDSKKQGKIEVVEKILPILDTFARAEDSLKGQKEYDSFKMVSRQMEKILSEIGLEEVEVLGQDFDPNYSYAIMKEEAGEENVGKVIDVLSKGYKFNDKIVRYSQVKVGC